MCRRTEAARGFWRSAEIALSFDCLMFLVGKGWLEAVEGAEGASENFVRNSVKRNEALVFYPTARISSFVALRDALLSSAEINPSLVSSSRQYLLMLLTAVPCIDRVPR
jgi:hypothetical protein